MGISSELNSRRSWIGSLPIGDFACVLALLIRIAHLVSAIVLP